MKAKQLLEKDKPKIHQVITSEGKCWRCFKEGTVTGWGDTSLGAYDAWLENNKPQKERQGARTP